MKKYLSEISKSFFGANASAKHEGKYPCVQGRDFDADGIYIAHDSMYMNEDDVAYTQPLKKGHVLFSAKGKIFATVWQGQLSNAVASGTFIVLEVTKVDILPEYLALYLNSAKAKKYFDLHLKTATVKHIGKKQLDQLEIEIPSMEKQRSLVKVQLLIQEEKKLILELMNRKEKILNYLV